MNWFWKTWWGLGLMITPYIIGVLGVAIDVYIARSHYFNDILHALRRSEALRKCVSMWGSSDTFSRALIVSAMSGGLLFPTYAIKRGLLNEDDVNEFPKTLKRWMSIATWLAASGFMLSLFVASLLKITK